MKKTKRFKLLLINLIFLGFTEAGKLCDFAEKFPCKGKRCYNPPETASTEQNKRHNSAEVHTTTYRVSTDEKKAHYSSEVQTTSSFVSIDEKKGYSRIDVQPTSSFDSIEQDIRLIATELHNTVSLGTADSATVQVCPSNMVPGNGSCSVTCHDPKNRTGCVDGGATHTTCVCSGYYYMNGTHCVKEEECGCYLYTIGIIEDGVSFINSNCSKRYNCSDNHLTVDVNYQCSDNATCEERDGERKCYCKNGFEGDGVTCVKGKDCHELSLVGIHTDGVYTISPSDWEDSGFQVYCEMSTEGGGWTVFQRRTSGSVNFYRGWTEYKNGFENPSGDHWLGNDKIHNLTSQKIYQLRIDVTNSANKTFKAFYDSFSIDTESEKYKLFLGNYSRRSVKDALGMNSGYPFSTYDSNDGKNVSNCAEIHRGAWWYQTLGNISLSSVCFTWSDEKEGLNDTCSLSNLNGDYRYTDYRGIFWYGLAKNECGIVRTKMMIRPLE